MEKTLEERASELESRMGDVRDAIHEIRAAMWKAYADADLIADEARGLAWDGYSHDPRIEDDCPEACEDVDALYHESDDTARTLETLLMIADAIL